MSSSPDNPCPHEESAPLRCGLVACSALLSSCCGNLFGPVKRGAEWSQGRTECAGGVGPLLMTAAGGVLENYQDDDRPGLMATVEDRPP
ncbi:hypothetical protein P7K49_003382, partial [Saguinus oedipus]